MNGYIFEKSACVKDWHGDADKKANAVRTSCAIPSTDFIIAAAIGDIIDPVSKRHIPVPMPADGVVHIIEQHGWNTLGFDELAQKLTKIHADVSDITKETLKESEILLIQMRKGIGEEAPRDNVAPGANSP